MGEEIKRLKDNLTMMVNLYGLEFTTYGACYDRHLYLEYKDCKDEDIPLESRDIVVILRQLEAMGFPMNKVGTYLYKEMIENIMKSLENDAVIDSSELNNRYSQFYVDIARNNLDIGIKTFHRLIEASLADIDFDQFKNCSLVDGATLKMDYPSCAYKIAKNLYDKKRKDISCESLSLVSPK